MPFIQCDLEVGLSDDEKRDLVEENDRDHA